MWHEQVISGAKVYWDTHRRRWVDAWGPNVIKYIQDFVSLPEDDTTHDPSEWTCTMTEDGAGTTSAVLNTVAGGELLITTAGGEYDGINMQLKGEAFGLEADKPTYFGIKLKVDDATQVDLVTGLCITDTTLTNVDTSHATALSDGVYFESLDGVTTTTCVTEKASSETTSSSVGTLDTSYHIYEFYCDGVTKVYFYLDGVEVATSITNIPTEVLTPSITVRAGSDAARTCAVDWLRVIQLR